MYIQAHRTTTPDSKQKIYDYNGILLVDMDPKSSEPMLLVKGKNCDIQANSNYIGDDSMRFGVEPCPKE